MSTTESHYPMPEPVLESAFLGDEAVVFDPRTGSVTQLNSSAAALWSLLDGAHGADELAAELAEIFGAPLAAVRADVDAAIADFEARGLLVAIPAVADAGAGGSRARHHVHADGLVALARPPEPCACTNPFTAWAGRLTFRVGGYLVGVEYDSAETERAVRAACAEWPVSDVEVAPAFGVRTAPVGFRRRRVGLVHHGADVRYRRTDLDAAVAALVALLTDIGRDVRDDQPTVPFRVYCRDGAAVLVDAPAGFELDERRLRRARVAELPSWEPIVDTATGSIVTGSTVLRIAGIVETMASGSDRALLCSYVQGRAATGGQAWAAFVDGLGDRVVGVAEGGHEDGITSSVISLLGAAR